VREETFGVSIVNLKGLTQKELAEGATEKELTSAIGVSPRTLEHILADKLPADPATWEKFAKYVCMDVEFLRNGESAHAITILNLSGRTRQPTAGRLRRIPLLSWPQMGQLVGSKHPSGTIRATARLRRRTCRGSAPSP